MIIFLCVSACHGIISGVASAQDQACRGFSPQIKFVEHETWSVHPLTHSSDVKSKCASHACSLAHLPKLQVAPPICFRHPACGPACVQSNTSDCGGPALQAPRCIHFADSHSAVMAHHDSKQQCDGNMPACTSSASLSAAAACNEGSQHF